jgi:hypothetical protein
VRLNLTTTRLGQVLLGALIVAVVVGSLLGFLAISDLMHEAKCAPEQTRVPSYCGNRNQPAPVSHGSTPRPHRPHERGGRAG